jgi:hypothetical protein
MQGAGKWLSQDIRRQRAFEKGRFVSNSVEFCSGPGCQTASAASEVLKKADLCRIVSNSVEFRSAAGFCTIHPSVLTLPRKPA